MPFCPKCRYEYESGVSVCPDCDEPLVAELPPLESDDPSADLSRYRDWVQLARMSSPEYAELVLQALRSKDIPAVILSGTGHFGITGQMGATAFRAVGGGYSLMVPSEHIFEADQEGRSVLGQDWDNSLLVDVEGE
jgi:hypothetical protein